MRLTRFAALLIGLCTIATIGCGASSDELMSSVVTAEDARARLLARDEIVKLGEEGVDIFAKLLDFSTVRNLFETQVPPARLSEMDEEAIMREVTDIRITAVRGMAAIGSISATQPLIDASYLPESQTENLGEPIAIGEDELSIELAAQFRCEVMIALGQLAFGSEKDREEAIDLFSYGANDPDPGVRICTAGSLASLHLHESGYFLKQLAEDQVAGVRAATFNAIHAIGSYYVAHALQSISYGDDKTAELDRQNLKTLEDSVYQHCINALEDPEPSVRIPAIQALDVFDDTTSVTPLMRSLSDANERVRIATVNALASFENEEGKQAVETAVVAALGEDDPQRRMMAAMVLGRMRTGGEAMKAALLKPDELWFVKLQLINSLSNLDNEDYLGTINGFLDDPDRDVRIAAICGVGSLGSSEDLDRLIRYAVADDTLIPAVTHAVASIADYGELQIYLGVDNDQLTRLIAIDALSMRSNSETPAPPMLVELFGDPDITIVMAALDAVARYDYAESDDALAALVERGEDDYTIYGETKDNFEDLSSSLGEIYSVKMRAASMLASSDNRDGINHFIDMLSDPSVGRRLIGVACLGSIGHTRGVMPTVGLLNDGSDYVRWGAAQVLGIFADTRTTGFLGQALQDPNPWVQESAIGSILAIGDKNTIDEVRDILGSDVAPSVKIAALDFISRMGDKRMADDIAGYLKNEDDGVRYGAAVCLTRLNDEEGRGLAFLKEELNSTSTLTINPGLPPITPLGAGIELLAAELTGTPESQIEELATEPREISAWAYATQTLTGDIASNDTYSILAEKALQYDYLRQGLLDNIAQYRPTAYTAFDTYLNNDDAGIRQLGYAILVRIGGDKVLDRLTEQISAYPQDAPVLIVALDDLGAQTYLRRLFRTGDESIRVLVAERLAGWTTDKRMPLIWGQIATEDQSLAVRLTVLGSLAADPTGVGRAYLTQIIEAADSPPELARAARDALAGVELPAPVTAETAG
ncbi:MAG TPA: HEAT repeat domain-containing protein [bacterium]|nr:HEAT repeat domain-containing protein [bacterium]